MKDQENNGVYWKLKKYFTFHVLLFFKALMSYAIFFTPKKKKEREE